MLSILLVMYTWKTFRAYHAVWQVCPDVFSFPSSAHFRTRMRIRGKIRLARETSDNAMMMMIWDFKREGGALFQHLQGSYGRVLTPREATEAPTQRSRSPLSPTEVTELATVRLFLILSALLCSLRPGFCIVCDFAHAHPIMLQHSTQMHSIHIAKQPYIRNIHHFCPALSKVLVNTYREDIQLFIKGEVILSQEGTTQGEPLAMAMYAIAISLLSSTV